jgi:hypothetical protein
MAVRKKSKGAGRKTGRRPKPSRKVTTRRKAGKAAARSTRKRSSPATHKARSAPPARSPKVVDSWAAPRCRSRIPVEIDIAGRCERGAIADMSSSGARIVGIRLDVAPGTPLRIRYASGTAPMTAEVVRATDDGFAVKIIPR